MTMELRQLRYFREVVRLGSFRKASERLFITQPALTKSIRALEEELGAQLLERGAQGVTTTPFGAIMVSCADSVAIDIARATEEIVTLNGRAGGIVRVGGMPTVMQLLMPKLVARLRETGSEIRVVASIALLDEVVSMLIDGEIDVAIGTLQPWYQSELIIGEELLSDEVCLVCRHDHPLLDHGDVALSHLAPYRWVIGGQADPWRRRLVEMHHEAGLPEPVIAFETGSVPLVARVMETTDYLSVLPRRLLALDRTFEQLRPLALKLPWPTYEVHVAYRRASVALPSTRELINVLKRLCRQL
jgi:DNA-binding transcriptional LysR family regulator